MLISYNGYEIDFNQAHSISVEGDEIIFHNNEKNGCCIMCINAKSYLNFYNTEELINEMLGVTDDFEVRTGPVVTSRIDERFGLSKKVCFTFFNVGSFNC
ncbi:hypothetical protein AVI51_07325 [Piscirickettsia salmonis]|uniref:Uncharacterized protein n=1 Tax=Piscirickettsia salmonis TaxID=1238 RepID=A0A9Q5YHD3_PISSA|nr:hypothetical protein [Piscirickettsia salmonis]ALA25887.1 uncharacterized protein KU39_03642 [Piscirickettsia salmonis]APS43359.1 hypothetical protein AVI48_02535 [Piscirickettsia salmonis]APS46710.1 hypothetical protein AVI49_03140 [Piscirickettsia salmonis]APS50683.1 hypothetical protein AVI50_07410 [Piscirickettsia salmonis]APS53887.1 hypothetical protein AVI51_07325 [Piscirickettsia salmonis]